MRNGSVSGKGLGKSRRAASVYPAHRDSALDMHETVDAVPSAVVTVTDNGRGLSETDRAHLFDPFYSGRDAGRGLGFGLCKCWRIVTNHGGWIDVDAAPGVGTTFRVFWPDRDTLATETRSERPQPATAHGSSG